VGWTGLGRTRECSRARNATLVIVELNYFAFILCL
jgi:hypothetical protein